jgi:hypothetical protein
MHGETRNVHIFLVGKAYGKRLHERLVYKWENNIEMDYNDVDFKHTKIVSFLSS